MFLSGVRGVAAALVAALVTGCSGGGTMVSTLPRSPSAQSVVSTQTRSPVLREPSASITAGGVSDDFSSDPLGGPAVGWTVESGTWSVCQGGSAHAYCSPATARAVSLIGATTWTNYTVTSSVYDPNVTLGAVAIVGRALNSNEYYQLALGKQVNGSMPYWFIGKVVGSKYTILASGPLAAPDANPNYRLRMAFAGTEITASVAFDGGTTYRTLGVVDDSGSPNGPAGLSTSGTALARFSNFTVSLTRPPLISESAISTPTFLDSIGLNAILSPPAYNQTARTLMGNLGVRHYRIAASDIVAGTPYVAAVTDLFHAYGITFDVLANLLMPAAQVVTALELLPAGSVNSVEGPNEADCMSQGIYYDSNFANDLPVYMASLYAAIKSTPATSKVTVIGPALCHSTAYAAIGNISSYVDAGNMHDYFAGFNPGSQGWGPDGYSFAPGLHYGQIAWNIAMAGQATGTKPVYATETGYCTARLHGCVPLNVQAKYVPRLYLEQYRNGVPGTYVFKLIESNSRTGLGSLGLVSPSGEASPAYTALAGMIAILKDAGAATPRMNYSWALAGQTTGVDHLLMHKADGTLIVPLWIEAKSFDPNADGGLGSGIAVSPQLVMVNLQQTTGSGTLWTCNAGTGVWSSSPVSMTNGSFNIELTDTASILVVKPA